MEYMYEHTPHTYNRQANRQTLYAYLITFWMAMEKKKFSGLFEKWLRFYDYHCCVAKLLYCVGFLKHSKTKNKIEKKRRVSSVGIFSKVFNTSLSYIDKIKRRCALNMIFCLPSDY